MKTRAEAARYVEALIDDRIKLNVTKRASHFGKVELRMLMDFIYEGLPQWDEMLGCDNLRNDTAAKNKRFDDDKGS